MSDMSMPTDVGCPGQKKLIAGLEGQHYIKMVFGVYRQNGPASFEAFYLTNVKLDYSYSGLKELETQIVALLNANEPNISNPAMIATKFPHYDVVPLTEADIADADWRVIGEAK